MGLIALWFGSSSCWFQSAKTPDLQINLYSGVVGIARLGDPESENSPSEWKCEREEIAPDSDLGGLNFTSTCHYRELGIQTYFRFGRLSLMEIQEPFHGIIRGMDFDLFSLGNVGGGTWHDALVRKFGAPVAEASGGRLSSEALFYDWGDIAYNGAGINQLSLYHEPKVRTYRNQNFGRVLDLGFH